MPHFTVRNRLNNAQLFQNVPQTGKKFFYHLDAQRFPVDENTVINYELTLNLSHQQFIDLINNMTGNPNRKCILVVAINNMLYTESLSIIQSWMTYYDKANQNHR